jgi:hypothetical protein
VILQLSLLAAKIVNHCRALMSPKVELQTSELPVPLEVSVFHHRLSQVKKVFYPARLGFTPLLPQARPQ